MSTDRKNFDRLREHVAAALEYEHGTHTVEDVWDQIEAGHAQLWYGPNSVIITQIEETPQRRILRFWLAGGYLEELEPMYIHLEAWGRDIGCDMAVIVGRKGWERTFLKREGWAPTHTVFTKELDDGEEFNTDGGAKANS